MPRKGMRSVFFRSSTTVTPSASSSPSSSHSPTPFGSLNRSRYAAETLYSFSPSMLKETLMKAEQIINKWNPENDMFSKPTSYLFKENNRREAKEFVKCVQDLQRAMNFLICEDSNSEKLVSAQNLMEIAMKRLEKEFYQILSTNRDHLDPESISARSSHSSQASRWSMRSKSFSDYEDENQEEEDIQEAEKSITKVEEVSSLAMVDIKMIADCMISAGYGKECIKIYKIIRKSIVDEGLYRLGIVHIKSSRIRKMDSEVLEIKIKNWLNVVKIAVRTLFYGERVLCDHVFGLSEAIKESCFSEICKQGGRVLFGFPKKIAKSKKPTPERVFRILDLYKAVAELWPEIQSIFSFESTSIVRSKALGSLTRLGDSVRLMLTEFESSIHKDSSKSHTHGGGVHPITRSVTNFLRLLSDYRVILADIFTDWPLPVQSPLPETLFDRPESVPTPLSAISVRFAWLILVLLCKIDMKVESYKDVALSYLFLANNLQCVVSNVRTSNLRFILGEEWISKHEIKLKQYISNYEKVGWNKVISVLPENQAEEITQAEVRFRFMRFNSAFEATCRTQSSWVVPDSELRKDIEVAICEKVIPTYTEFYEKYRDVVPGSHIKFAPDELINYISSLFHDTQQGFSSPTSSSESH